jgi:hypothetical protein
MKQGGEAAKAVSVICPANINSVEEKAITKMAREVFDIMSCPDSNCNYGVFCPI